MKPLLKQAMKTSISEVLETMFYQVLKFDSPNALKMKTRLNAADMLACQIDFAGIFSGHLSLFIPRELSVLMTENFMAEKRKNITDDHLDQMTKEIMNMVAGSTFSHFNDQLEFRLSIPQRISASDTANGKPDSTSDGFTFVETTDGCLAFNISIDT